MKLISNSYISHRALFRRRFLRRIRNLKKTAIAAILFLTFTVGLTFFIQPSKAASVTILSYSEVTEVAGSYLVFGEIKNLGTSPVYSVEINASFYDSSNTMIAEGWGRCELNVILPNCKSPFTVWVHVYSETQAIDIDETQASKIDHYTIEAIPSNILPPDHPLGLKILSSSANLDSISGVMTIIGEIELTDTTNVSSNTRVSATLYDSDGRVVAVNGDNLDQLLPGQKASFEIAFWPDAVTLAKSYVLTANSIEYSCFEYPELPTPTPSSTPSSPPTDTSPQPADTSVPPLDTTVWVPPTENAAAATAVTAVAVGAASVVVSAVSNPAGMPTGKIVEKTSDLLPESVKKWLADFVSSKRESTVDEKTGSLFLPTKSEAVAYTVSLAVLTLSFSYVKVNDLSQILSILPNVLVTAIILEFVKTFVLEVFARSRGVWTEHKLWYLGLVMFLLTTFAFGIPFSYPSRNVHHAPKLTKRIHGIVSLAAIFIVLAFAAFFFVLLISGFTLIGSTGLAMCVITAFLDTFPVAPMDGKAVYEHSKVLWVILFAGTLTLYGSWLLLL